MEDSATPSARLFWKKSEIVCQESPFGGLQGLRGLRDAIGFAASVNRSGPQCVKGETKVKRSTIVVLISVGLAMLVALPAEASIVTLNTQGSGVVTNVAAGVLSFDELVTSTSHTYVNVAGAGFDLRVSSSSTMDYSTGDLNYVKPGQSLLFEFFATGTAQTTKIDVLGFAIDWRDLDVEYGGGIAGTFTIKDRLGSTTVLDTSSSIFTRGTSLTTWDAVADNGVNPDAIKSSGSGNWDNLNTAFISNLASIPLHSFSLDYTSDWIAPTSLRLSVNIAVVPEPATIIIWSLLGFGSWLGLRISRRRGSVGRQAWSDENRQAIQDIVARGMPR